MSDMSFSVPPGFKKVEGPLLFKFEKPGDQLRGIFLRANKVFIEADEVVEMFILQPGGQQAKFRAGFDLREKITKGMIGKELLIRYMSDDPSKGKNGNPMKVFGVWAREMDPQPEDGSYQGTDEDIPF